MATYYVDLGSKQNVSTSGASGAHGLLVDPLLGAGYRPSASSPCVGGVYASGTRHFGGVPMGANAPDIGALRYFAQRSAAMRSVARR